MGINTTFGALLCRARRRGARFDRTATIGRLSLYIPPDEIERLARGVGVPAAALSRVADDGFADEFLRVVLGAKSVTAIDASAYQGAQVIHDLNLPLDPSLHRSFDAVIDGGTLEHLFDVKQALANYMSLVERGGHLFLMTPANNLYGHGFYQFGAEFFCRAFDASNGFSVQSLGLMESTLVNTGMSRRQRVFEIEDPAAAGGRVQLVNGKPVEIFVHASRIGDEQPFRTAPAQSDYSEKKWRRAASPAPPARFAYLKPWQELLRRWKQRRRKSFRNQLAFRALDLGEDSP